MPTAGDPSSPAVNTPAEGAPPSTPRKLTAREQRREDIEARAQKADAPCLYCLADAQYPFPYAEFTVPSFDVGALFTGDLPHHWRVRAPDPEDAAPVLCAAHHTIARSAVELRIAQAHTAYVGWVAAQKEELHEFAAHGLDETMRAEALRVSKGTPRGGT